MKKIVDLDKLDIVKLGQKTMLEDNVFSVSWILGRFCNYDCSYCWPYAKSKTVDHRPLLEYIRTMDEIKSQARAHGFDKFHFSFSGGEPTAYKGLTDLIKAYQEPVSNYLSLHMTTNASPGFNWWNKWLTATEKLDRKSITASYHAEFSNEKEFAGKLNFLQEHGVLVTINQVMVPDRFDEYYGRAQRFKDQGLHVTLKPQSNDTASAVVEGYSAEQWEILQNEIEQETNQLLLYDKAGTEYNLDQAERLNAYQFNKFKGWMCNAGYQSCIIREPGGEIKRAYSCHDEPLGTIETGFTLFKERKVCITPTCVSSADSKIPKELVYEN
jgi:MoaA/NifB/PqqE/SkfB family radical SAM enzyme